MNEYLVGIHGDMKEKQKQRQRENREVRILLRVEVRVRSLLVLDLEFIIKVSNPWGLNFLLLFFFLYFFIKIKCKNKSFIYPFLSPTDEKSSPRNQCLAATRVFECHYLLSLSLSLSLQCTFQFIRQLFYFFWHISKYSRLRPYKNLLLFFCFYNHLSSYQYK